MEEESETIKKVKSLFDEISPVFDSWLKMLPVNVYGYVTLEHLKKHLPKDRNSLILDAGGGTGRWAVPLAKMGYQVILCDISKGMLKQAENNIQKEGLLDKIKIKEEDIANLSFPDQMFDFVLCEDGPISISNSQKIVMELRRVLKDEGKIWASVIGRYSMALAKAKKNTNKALKLSNSELNYIYYKGIEKCRIFSPKELQNLFQKSGFNVIKIYGNRIIIPFLSKDIQSMTNYDDAIFSEIAGIELLFSEEPSLLGLAEYLQIVCKK